LQKIEVFASFPAQVHTLTPAYAPFHAAWVPFTPM